uniref:5'-nucleotidase domain-containing protein 3 isoform X5 n=1 Tax=Ictidomys tridecemlineatus TaxID=43179 RepID=UPI001A9E0C16|nr:5'-nucleotidase domain-containing protein 3 isoform X5 [Ictidomys tridecemlineatus]
MNQKANENVERVAQFIVKPQTPIRPYICSTLNDFQEERNFLATNIFPQLNELCNSRGTYFKPVDLRWSVLKAQKSLPANLYRQGCCLLSQQLKLCLDYVNSCFPFFICMLGQTYGDFFPDHSPFMFSKAKDLSNLSKAEQNLYVAAKNGYPWVLETPNCSLTEFEIIQAAFRNQSQFQYFYFRTRTTLLKILSGEEEESLSSGALVNEEEKLKIGRLKAKIISKGLPIRFYKDLQELGELVFKDWSFVIEKLNPITLMIKNIDYRHSLECFYHEEFIEKCKQAFVSSKESNRIFEILEQFVLKDEGLDLKNAAADSNLVSVLRINSLPAFKSILLLSGERGCGKSTLIANFVNYFKNKYPSIWIIPHFVGSTCESSDIVSVIHYFITELQHKNHNMQPEMDFLNEDSNILSFSLLVEVFIASISLKPCILVLDGIEELIGIYGISGQKAKDFSWLPHSLPPHCKFILSTVSSSLSCKLLCARADVKIVELTSVGDEDTRLSIFRQHLFTPGQDPSLHSRLALKKKPSLSPLKLTVLANELKECRIYRSELQCLKEYLEVASLQEFWELILKRWTEDYSWTIKQKKAKPDNGTSEEVLEWKLSNVTATDKCRLMFCIGSFLKLMGKIREAKELFLSTEDMLMQSQSTREMLLKAQNAIGELYVEIGNTQEGFKYFQKAWSNLQCLPLSDFKDNRNLMKQKVRVLNNLAKWASEEYLKENHVLEYATEVSKLVDNIPHDQATMKYTEGVLMLVDGNTYLAKMKFQECLRIRRSLFGEKNMLVGEIMEILADLLFFLLTDNEKLQRKQVIEYYKQVIKIKENADALANSSLVRKQLSISLSDTLCKLAGYLLTSDSCHHVMIEAIGYLYRSLDLRETYLGPSHSSIHGIMHLLKEIERTRSRKFWPLGMLQQSPESSKNGSLLWEHLLKLDYHSAQSSNTVSSVMRINAAKLTRAKSLQLAPHQISDKSKYAIRKKISSPIICISAGKKTQEKVQNNVEIWDSPRKEASKKKKDYSIEVLPSGKKSGLVKLSKQRILSDESMSGAGHVTTIYHSPLLGPFTTNDSWHSISELISEKWLFHNPDYNWTPPKSILKRKSQVETKSLKNSTNKE